MVKRKLILLCALIIYATFVDGQSDEWVEGDRCTTRSTQSGICTRISGCISVQNDLRQGKRNHVVCGYDGHWPIVCCPSGQARSTTTTTTTRPTATQRYKSSDTIDSPRISVRKCNEYKEFAYNEFYVTNVFGPPLARKVSNCAFTAMSLIVGGTEAIRREFPHMALIGFEHGNKIHWDCGGTLISEQFVLSAAHCLRSDDYGPAKYVRLGEHDLKRGGDGAIDLRIIQSFPHPEYRSDRPYNDIGLFKLEENVEFDEAIRPACLPERSAVPTKTIATGWGDVTWGGTSSNVLLKVILELFSQNECNSTYRMDIKRTLREGIIEETQVCAGSHTEEKDSCQGDSGGPLQIYHEIHNCTYTIVGVTSFGKACGIVATPGVYTRVYAYLNWIEQNVWPNE